MKDHISVDFKTLLLIHLSSRIFFVVAQLIPASPLYILLYEKYLLCIVLSYY